MRYIRQVWILVVLAAQPPRLLSTLEYIATFRSPHRLAGERHYYLVQLQVPCTLSSIGGLAVP